MTRHTAEEYDTAIKLYYDIMKRDGATTSKKFIAELSEITGKPPEYWHVIELLSAIRSAKAKTLEAGRRKKYELTAEHEKLILDAAEIITSRQAVPKISAQDIRAYFTSTGDKNGRASAAAITHASAEEINKTLRRAGYTQYKTGNYITSMPPARHTAEMETRALRILEAAEDPQSGIAEKLHEIRYDHKFRDATAEELQAAILDGFMQGDHSPATRTFNRSANNATRRKTRRRIRKYGTMEPPTAEDMDKNHRQAFHDLKAAREAAGKTPAPLEDVLYFLAEQEPAQKAAAKQQRTRKYKFEPTPKEAAQRKRASSEDTPDQIAGTNEDKDQ